jgi:hypothetical protein
MAETGRLAPQPILIDGGFVDKNVADVDPHQHLFGANGV